MMKWRRILSIALLLALFLAPLMQAAAMNTLSGMADMSSMAGPVKTAPDAGHAAAGHESHASHDGHLMQDTDTQKASSDCHGNAGMLDCCAHCGGCGIPISIRFAPGATGVEHFTLLRVPPQPVLDPKKRPPRTVS